ncbi:uncharacterized protein LOC110627715 isoform X2 [Manihot esculenta]|uniref:Rotamase n=1 Tax=Manihot esculenta TaxID=3983 RepID=A0A2C9UXE8_MANES|nr:uncharacterized protein LOC110627715 isoform X2 [Manihot esculenta]OAY35722.1 hypothetical protein MANES_12G124800v8 [Manihot esculenta]
MPSPISATISFKPTTAGNLILFVAMLMMFSTSLAGISGNYGQAPETSAPLPTTVYTNKNKNSITGKRKAGPEQQTNEADKRPKLEPQPQDISPAASHHHEAESICINSDISQEDHYRPPAAAAISFASSEAFVSPLEKCFHADFSISPPILSPAIVRFPFDDEGKLVEVLDYKNHHELKLIRYKDIVLGRGQPVIANKLKVTFHYDLYDEHNKRVQTNALDRSPEEVHLCWHRFGRGFEEGIRGMRPGGIRRVIVPREEEPPMIEGYGVFDVALLKVEISCSCPQPHAEIFNL